MIRSENWKEKSPWILALILVAALGVGCASDPTAPGGGGGDGEYDEVLDSAGSVFDLGFVSGEVLDDEPTEVGSPTEQDHTREDGSRWRCRRQRVSDVNADEDYWTFNPNSTVIWPGNLLQGASLTNSTPSQIVVDRGPMDMAITLLNGSSEEGTSALVESPTGPNVLDAINGILANNPGIVPANFTFEAVSVSSHEEMAAELRVDVNTLSTDFKSQLSFSSDESKSHMLVTFNQQMYTIVVTPPTDVEDFFTPDVTPEDLELFVGPANPPTYISAVTYGRRFYALVESNASRLELEASVDASYDGAVTDGNLEADAEYVLDLEGTSVKVFNMGGTASSIPQEIKTGSLQNLHELLSDEDNELFYSAMPLSYVVNDIRTHQIVHVKSATEYDIVECVPLDISDGNVLFQFVAEDLVAPFATGVVVPHGQAMGYNDGMLQYGQNGAIGVITQGADMVETWEGTKGTIASYEGMRPVLLPNETPTGKAAVGFGSVNLSAVGEESEPPFANMEMAFSGAGLEQTSYTLSAVVEFEDNIQIRQWSVHNSVPAFRNTVHGFNNAANVFLYGTTHGTAGNRRIGDNLLFGSYSGLMYLAQEGYYNPLPVAPTTGHRSGAIPLDVYHVLTVVVKLTEDGDAGHLQLWINNDKVYEGPPPAEAVQNFTGARMGASYFNTWEYVLGPGSVTKAAFLKLAELRAYDLALTDLQVETIVSNMRAEYGI